MKTPRKQLNLSVFILALMKNAKSQRNVMGQKGESGECEIEGNLARRPVCSDSSVFLVTSDRRLLFFSKHRELLT